MARKMKKFSAGGAQGRYERRMADIEKDYAKAAARKTGKAAEVAEAKRQQRIADAKDDLAKRTGADRTATRKAEYDAEKNLSRTRKFGADKPAADPAKAALAAQIAAAPEAAKAKPKTTREEFNAAFRAARNDPAAMKRGTFTFRGTSYSTKMAGEGRKPVQKAAATPVKAPATPVKAPATPVKAPATPVKAPATPVKAPATAAAAKNPPATSTTTALLLASKTAREKAEKDAKAKADKAKADKVATNVKRFASRNVQSAYGAANMAKGGSVKEKEKVMMDKKKKPAVLKRPMPKEPITGGADTVPLTPGRKEFLKELAKRNAKPGMAKGGKATKFGAAMKKKSADTKGRAMVKKAGGGKCYASGGLVGGHKSADGIAKKGKTKGKMV
jgi:hypothetical protein